MIFKSASQGSQYFRSSSFSSSKGVAREIPRTRTRTITKRREWLRVLGLLLFLIGGFSSFGQEGGTVSGIVVSTWDATPLSGVAVTVRGTTLATQSGSDGRFELKNVPSGDQVLRFSKSGFASAVVTDVRVLIGQSTTVNGNLRPEFYEMEEYEVTAEEFTEQTEQILIERQQASGLMDAIGSETMSRMGAGDAAEAMAKVTGTTIVEGKFAVIRGLADRYTASTLNGGEIPSADPYRKAAQLDLFPSEMISSIVVTKTFTPDQPGGFTGGAVDIITKSFPEKRIFSASVGTAYSSATGNDRFLTYEGGDRDWLGMDDGTRAEPQRLARIEDATQEIGSAPSSTNSAAPSLLRYQKFVRSFDSIQFAPTRSAPPPNHSFSSSLGDSYAFGDNRFGYFTGLSYSGDFSFYDGRSERFYPQDIPGDTKPNTVVPSQIVDTRDERAFDTVTWAGTVGLALSVGEDHEVGFTFLYNQLADDLARLRTGKSFQGQFPISEGGTGSDLDTVTFMNELHWTERHLEAYQFRGRHEFPAAADVRLDWMASLATTTQVEPDLRYFNFRWSTNDGTVTLGNSAGVPEPSDPTRYFRDLKEDNQSYKVDGTLPFNLLGADGKFKMGLSLNESDREFSERTWSFRKGRTELTTDPRRYPNEYMNDENTDLFGTPQGGGPNRRTNFTFVRFISSDIGNSSYQGSQLIEAVYLMAEVSPVTRLRIGGGARLERTDIQTEFQTTRGQAIQSQQTTLEQTDILRAVNLTWEVITNMNLRLSYGETVARPTLREIAPYRSYDVTADELFEGNGFVQMSAINNYDIRWEWFRRPGEILSIGAFYKDIAKPIEKVSYDPAGEIVTITNFPNAKVYGVEFEARSSLDLLHHSLSDFSLGGNVALIKSEVEIPDVFVSDKQRNTGQIQRKKPLTDQSPYIINTDLSYDNRMIGTMITLAGNLSGERLFSYNVINWDVYEQPAPSLDLFITQRLGKHWRVKFSAKNLLDPEYKRIYGKAGEFSPEPLYSSYRKGRTFGLSLSCEF
jgi:TonB-dependent receptor